jgi:acetylornithine deacetylase
MSTAELTGALTELERRVVAAVDANEERLVDTLRELVRFRTPNPPGGNEGPAQDWMEERFRRLELEIDRWDALPGRPNVIGTLRGAGGGPSVALNSHIDVCEDRLLEEWSSDAYDPVIDGRDMIGRGASDMKCAMASFLVAVETLNELGIRLKGDVIVQSVIGEEAGEPGTRSAIEHGYGGDFAIVGESSRGTGIVACIGVVNCRITIESPYTLHLVARKFTLNAGGGLEGANCVEKMATRIVPALLDLERQWAVDKTHPLVPPGACNINVFRLEGGANTFILPDRCDAYVTVTYLPHERREDVEREVEAQVARAADLDPWLRKYPPRVEWGPAEYPIEFASSDFDPESAPVRLLAGSIRAATGLEPVMGGRGGITDAGWFHRAGVPAVVYGPGDVDYAHRVDERVHLDDVLNHCRTIAVFLTRYCEAA